MLASVQRVIKITPIEGADRIETARVLGWDCVVRKGTFKEGDLCIYIEIDTLIPTCLLSEKVEDREKYTRLKTVKMKGQLSQGLALALSCTGIKVLLDSNADYLTVNEGDDVTEYLRIRKYEKEIPEEMKGIMVGGFPHFVPRTDEIRIQSAPFALNALAGKPYYITVKMDGTSATYFKFKESFGVCSRNIHMRTYGDKVYHKIAKKYNLEELLPEGYSIQGEICGPAIQQNRLELTDHDFYVFNVWNIKEQKYLDFNDFMEFCNDLGLNVVPVFEYGDCFAFTQDELLELAKGKYPNTNNDREGIVVRSRTEMYCRGLANNRLSFKVLNNDFLLKNGE